MTDKLLPDQKNFRVALSTPEQEKMKEKNKLEELRRKASEGEKAYKRGESTPIKDDDALDRFFSDIAKKIGEANSDR